MYSFLAKVSSELPICCKADAELPGLGGLRDPRDNDRSLAGKRVLCLGSPVVHSCSSSFWVPLLSPNRRKKGTHIMRGLLGNLDVCGAMRVLPGDWQDL